MPTRLFTFTHLYHVVLLVIQHGIFNLICSSMLYSPNSLVLLFYSYWALHDFYRLASLPAKEAACQLLEKAGVKGWECGRTKVFLKFSNSEQLEECTRDISRKAVIVQKCEQKSLA